MVRHERFRSVALNCCLVLLCAGCTLGGTGTDEPALASVQDLVVQLKARGLEIGAVFPPEEGSRFWLVCVGEQELRVVEYVDEQARKGDLPEDPGDLDLMWGYISWWSADLLTVRYHTFDRPGDANQLIVTSLNELLGESPGTIGFPLGDVPDPIPPDEACV